MAGHPRLPEGKLDHEFLKRLLGKLPSQHEAVLLGPMPGSDAALLRLGNVLYAVTSDPITFVTARLAEYLIQVNANDLAVCGARPEFLVLDLLLPPETSEDELETLFEDLRKKVEALGITVVGGHTEVTDAVQRMVAIGTLWGRVVAPHLHPHAVRPGDRLLQVRPVPMEGMAILAQEIPDRLRAILSEREIERCRRFLDDPGIGVLPLAERIWALPEVHWMHDPTEGGIATAIHEMAMATGLGIEVEQSRILVLPEAQKVAVALGFDPLGLIASGSLLVAVAPEGVEKVLQVFKKAGVPVQEIGVFQEEPVVSVQTPTGSKQPLPLFPQDELTRLL